MAVDRTVKPWSRRFERPLDDLAAQFNASVTFDQRLAEEDIAGSIAHVRMLGGQGIMTEDEASQIIAGLDAIREEVRAGAFPFRIEREDIHMNVETALAERIGPVAGKLHTGRSRNDQVALDVRLFVRAAIQTVRQDLLVCVAALLAQAQQHQRTVLPGYTHMQRAQPVLLAHHFLAYVEMLRRDFDRLGDAYRRTDVLPLGAGALAGTTFPLDRAAVARDLGLTSISRNSLDAVADRDFAVEFLAAVSLIMTHLSRLAEELVLWSSQEFGFVTLDDTYATGSSMMPQKKNPDSAELVRGKTGRVYGDLLALLTTLKGLPLSYNKDLQEDKEPLFDAFDTTHDCLRIMAGVVRTLHIHGDSMRLATQAGYVTATDLADYLVTRGLPFREAHGVVAQLVRLCETTNRTLEALSLADLRGVSPVFDADAFAALDVDSAVARRAVAGGTAPERVAEALAEAQVGLEKQAGD
ncbi:MAG TPA: argininosuccinate lyase [Chloroflexota bacterium]|nr:argininosuccinate lyase [Chloroflexota bacterium]